MVHKLKGLTEVHSKHSHCATVTTVCHYSHYLYVWYWIASKAFVQLPACLYAKVGVAHIALND